MVPAAITGGAMPANVTWWRTGSGGVASGSSQYKSGDALSTMYSSVIPPSATSGRCAGHATWVTAPVDMFITEIGSMVPSAGKQSR